ncbi:MAG: DUF3347 domain-containing protein [Chitinophagaceae bacterium]
MKRILAILGILLLALVAFVWFFYFRSGKKRPKGPEPVPLAVSKHSDTFNQSVQSLLDAYYAMSEGLVNWDTVAVNKQAAELKTSLDNLKIDELKVDTTGIYESILDPLANAKAAVATILSDPSIVNKRVSFNSLSENLRLVFIVVKYDANKLYWQECPMAFGDGKPGNWLSKTDAVRNPYMGNKHPDHKSNMLQCGGPKDTINFMAVDTTRK